MSATTLSFLFPFMLMTYPLPTLLCALDPSHMHSQTLTLVPQGVCQLQHHLFTQWQITHGLQDHCEKWYPWLHQLWLCHGSWLLSLCLWSYIFTCRRSHFLEIKTSIQHFPVVHWSWVCCVHQSHLALLSCCLMNDLKQDIAQPMTLFINNGRAQLLAENWVNHNN